MYVEFNSVALFTVLYSRFMNCAKDVSKVTAQPTILEFFILHYILVNFVILNSILSLDRHTVLTHLQYFICLH